jgi:uncharacterized protein (TIGR02453 family)
MAYFSEDYLSFFSELSENNHKDWFDANRKRYEKVVKAPFKAFVEDMIIRVNEVDPDVQIEAKDAIFRINRDIRFSKDKTPYKTNVSAIVSPGGRKDKTCPGLYFEFSAERVRIYGGLYMADKDQLLHLREEIAANPARFEKIINHKDFKSHYGEILGEKAKRLPKELKEAAEKQPLIYNKQFYYFAELPPETILRDDLADIVMKYYQAGEPLMMYLRDAL